MNREEFQSLSIKVLSKEASEIEADRHELVCNTEKWAKDDFRQLQETHHLLVQTLPQLSRGIEHSPDIKSKELEKLLREVSQQHPLAGTVETDQEIYQDLVRRFKKLPTLPVVLQEINKVLHHQDSNVVHVEELMSGDKSLTTTVLRIANSAHFGLPQRVFNLNQAISIIGFDEIQQIVLTASVISSFGKLSTRFFTLNNFWRHSIGVALVCNRISKELGIGEDRMLYTCGLLHDVGKVGNLLLDTRGYLEIINDGMEKQADLHQAEKEAVFPEHSKLGGAICERWQLPSVITQAVSHHHDTDVKLRASIPDLSHKVTDCVHLADQIVREDNFGFSGNTGSTEINPGVLDRLDLHPIQMEELRTVLLNDLEEAHGLLDVLPQQEGVA